MSDISLDFSVSAKVSKTVGDKLVEIRAREKITISNLISIALEHELERENPFEYEREVPDDEFVPMAYIEEAGKILNYMKKVSGMSLDMMCLFRHDMGVPDKKVFLLAFRECVIMKQLEPYKPKVSPHATFKYDETYEQYRVKGAGTLAGKKVRKKASEYEIFQRLKKRYKDE